MTGAAIVRENRFVATENGTIFVRITGCGDPLLMIHGTASDADYFKDSVPLLSDSCKVISYDRNETLTSEGDLLRLQEMGIDLKLDFILNHLFYQVIIQAFFS